jgi:all-trans-retinol 13,14-reductase
MDKHIIIIGSGLGGLTCGYILAKNGYRVSILEKNAQTGGCLQTFTRRGVKFETGMHYIGSMEKGQSLYNFFNYLSLLPDVKLRSLDKMAYETISIGGERFAFANGEENFVETLAQKFPDERKNLQNYFHTIKDVANDSPLYSFQYTNDSITLLNPNYIKKSASGFIESATPNRLLQRVLAGNLPLYAGIEEKTPLYIHALINDFYNQSTYRIVGGSDSIAHSLIKSIRSMGGEVHACSQVTKINCNNTHAVSVTLENGEELTGDYFISNIHPKRMVKLLDTHLIRKSYRERITCLRNTIGNFTVYIHFKKDTVPYFNSNLYHYNEEEDVWRGSNYTQDTWPNNFLYMHLCSSIDQQYADSAILMSYMNYEDVAQWEGTQIGRRGEAYEAFKQQKAERF